MNANLIFGWPFRFFHPQEIAREYSIHSDRAATITFREEHNVFRIDCDEEDIDYHAANFLPFVNGYVKRELDRPAEDLVINGPVRIARLRFADDDRSQYYNLAKKNMAISWAASAVLVHCEQFREMVSYPSATTKERPINKQLVDAMAEDASCELRWTHAGIEITSDVKDNAQKLAELLEPIVRSLDGVCVDLYSVESPLNLKFQFRRPALAADRTLSRTKSFPEGYLELHRIQWDPNSLQNVTYRPKELGKIECSAKTRNPWHKQKLFQYGTEEHHPGTWQATLKSGIIVSRFMLKNKANEIHNWAEHIQSALVDTRIDENTTTVTPSVPDTEDLRQSVSRALRIEKEDDNTEVQAGKTDIEERKQNYNFDRPRIRPAPQLKAKRSVASTVSSSSAGTETKIMKFIEAVAGTIELLLLQFKAFGYEETSLRLEFGQIYIPATKVDPQYHPDEYGQQEVFPGEYWARIFPTSTMESGASYFAKQLTTCADDALYMAVTTKGGKYLTDRTWYTLTCQNKSTAALATITIKEGKASIQAKTEDIGSINIHFPEVIWDARIKTSLTRPLSANNCKAFEELQKTIYIGQGPGLPLDSEAVYLRKPPNVKIISCQRHRERVHRVVHGPSNKAEVHLHITRTEELQLAISSPVERGFYVFSADDQNSWFQAHLSSAAMTSLCPPATASMVVIKEVMAPLLDAMRGLVTKWNDVGAGDRAKVGRLDSSFDSCDIKDGW